MFLYSVEIIQFSEIIEFVLLVHLGQKLNNKEQIKYIIYEYI